MKARSSKIVAGLIVLGLAATACSEEETGTTSEAPAASESTAGSDTTAAAETTVAGDTTPATDAADGEANAWALDYTGGTAGAASGDPIVIGYVNQESFFPESTLGLNAAVEYVNAELGGAAGRPIEVVECFIAVAEDGARCGIEMANNPDVTIVLTGTTGLGNKELYDSLQGKKPVIIGNGIAVDDFTTTAGVGFTTASPGTIPGLAGFIAQYLPDVKSVAMLASSAAGGQSTAELLVKPVTDKADIDLTFVGIDDTATAAGVQSSLQAAGADQVDALLVLVSVQQCINVYDSLGAMGIDPVVVTTGLCYGTPMTDHLSDLGVDSQVPDGWYFGGYGYSYFIPDYESGMVTYLEKVHQYGEPVSGSDTLEYTGFAGPTFANVMTLAKLINQLGADSLDYPSLDGAIRGFKGPMMLQAGPLDCGNQTILGLSLFVSVCGKLMGVEQYKDGEWISVAMELTGNAIDATTL